MGGAMRLEEGNAVMQDLPEGTVIILFVDIAESTALTEQLGDAAFRAKASALDAALRQTIIHFGGVPVEGKVLGDGVMALFRSARQAIECASHCRADGGEHGLHLHLGIHAGDVIREGTTVYGGAVNIAQRVTDKSAPGQILVSDTVRGLARTSADVAFRDRGAHALKGVADTVRLFEVCAPESEIEVDAQSERAPVAGPFRAILFTDIIGVGAASQRLGDAGARQLVRAHDAVVRESLREFRGTEIKHLGDGIMATFPSATLAIDSAIAMQAAFAERNRSSQESLNVRIGIGAGEPIEEDGDLFGTAVVLTSLLSHHALGSQILCSEAVVHVASGRRQLFSYRGETALKGFDDPQEVYEVQWRQ